MKMSLKRKTYDPNGNHKWEWTPEGKARLSEMRRGENNPRWKGGTSQNPQVKADYARQWRKKNEDYVRDREYRKRFGITKKIYDRLLIKQEGACAICKAIPKRRRLDVDHCHYNGKVRGLLCESCNKALGGFDDNPELLRAAIQYLGKPTNLKGGENYYALKIKSTSALP